MRFSRHYLTNSRNGGIINTLPIIIDKSSISNRLLQLSSDIGNFGGTIIGGTYPCLMLFPPLLSHDPCSLDPNLKHTSQPIDLSSQQPHQVLRLIAGTRLLQCALAYCPFIESNLDRLIFHSFLVPSCWGASASVDCYPKYPPVRYICCPHAPARSLYPNIPAAGVIAFIPLAHPLGIEFHLIDHLKKHGEIAIAETSSYDHWRSAPFLEASSLA